MSRWTQEHVFNSRTAAMERARAGWLFDDYEMNPFEYAAFITCQEDIEVRKGQPQWPQEMI